MSLDLKDTYFHIQVAPHHRRFLRFAFKGVAYQYKVLPFGLSLAPPTFTRCMDAALSPLRHRGIRILNYLDDWLILAQSQVVLTSHKTLLLSHLDCLGLRVNFAKSILLSPSQRVPFLGTVIDSVQMTATVSAERATKIQRSVFRSMLSPKSLCYRRYSGESENNGRIIPITPLWRNQPWVSELFQLLKAIPWPIPFRRDLLSQANGTIWHPRPELWALHVWPLEGSLSSSQSVS